MAPKHAEIRLPFLIRVLTHSLAADSMALTSEWKSKIGRNFSHLIWHAELKRKLVLKLYVSCKNCDRNSWWYYITLYTYIHSYTHARTHTHTHTYIRGHTHTNTQADTHTHTYRQADTHTHTYIHIYPYIYIYTRTHTHTHSLKRVYK
jgi:hypothetical protein